MTDNLAGMFLVALTYSCAVTWAWRTGGIKRLWIVTSLGVLLLALLEVAQGWPHGFRETSLIETLAFVIAPSIGLSALISLDRGGVRPAILVVAGTFFWMGAGFITLIVSSLITGTL